MKFALSAILAATLAVSSATAAKTHAKHQRKLDEMHAAAFGAVVTEHSASDWKKFLSEGPLPPLVQVDPAANLAEQKKPANNSNNNKNVDRELGYGMTMPMADPPPVVPKVGYYAIDNDDYGGSMEVQNKNKEQCFYINEGIGKDDWAFGITQGPVPGMMGPFDTFLQLFDKDAPVMPVYKAFQGAKQLCIGEKKGNIAYLYIVFGTGCYWLIGAPDAGRDDHLPKLKIRDQDRRRERQLGGSSDNDADKLNDQYNKGPGGDVIVRFRDGPGIVNTLWEIFNNGFSRTSPDAKWYFIPNDDMNLTIAYSF